MSGPLAPAAAERPEPSPVPAVRAFQGGRHRSPAARLHRLRVVTVAAAVSHEGTRDRRVRTDYRRLLMPEDEWSVFQNGFVDRHRNETLAEHEFNIGAMTKALEQQVIEEGNHTASQWKEVQGARSNIKLLDEAWRESDRLRRCQDGHSSPPAE